MPQELKRTIALNGDHICTFVYILIYSFYPLPFVLLVYIVNF